MARDLKNKTIIITGGSSGIGAATALAAGEAGMRVVLAARRRDRLEAVAAKIDAVSERVMCVTCDVNRDEDVDQLVRETVDRFGTLDVMFANAGYGLYASVLDTSPDDARAIFETNFWGTLRCLRAAAPIMKQQPAGGHMLICSSACSEISLPMYGLYSATKAAQDGLAGALRVELARDRIDVTSVHPIGTTSDFFPSVRERGHLEHNGLNTPDSMMQTPEHVAKKIIRALRRPRPEVWPSPIARLGLALTTLSPRLAHFVQRRMLKRPPTRDGR